MNCFVVLHYLDYQSTINCVDSILSLKNFYNKNSKIVIVDNNSNNGSIEIIEKKYINEDSIKIIRNPKNLGFASGNNIGYLYCKKHFTPNYITVLNNDIIIKSNDYLNLVERNFSEYQFDVMGPDIVNLDGENQNPINNSIDSKLESFVILINLILSYILEYIFIGKLIRTFKNKRKKNKLLKRSTSTIDNSNIFKEKGKVNKLHGSFLVFSRKYINSMDYAFYPETFLYFEEDILSHIIKRNNMIMIYNPNIKILHLEDKATNMISRNYRNKRLFVLKNQIKSCLILFKLLKKYKG